MLNRQSCRIGHGDFWINLIPEAWPPFRSFHMTIMLRSVYHRDDVVVGIWKYPLVVIMRSPLTTDKKLQHPGPLLVASVEQLTSVCSEPEAAMHKDAKHSCGL